MCCTSYYFNVSNLCFKSLVSVLPSQEGFSRIQITGNLQNSKRVLKEPLGIVEVSSKNVKSFIFKEICKVDSLLAAYEQIKFNLRMLLSGTFKTTLKNISKRWFIDTSERLIHHDYDFGVSKKVEFSKFNSYEKKSLIVFNPRNTIIELSILTHLEPLLEGV